MLSIILNIVTIALVIVFYFAYGTPKLMGNSTPESTPPWYWTASDAFDANSELVHYRRIY
jgi:hypothetical protein